jgi:hypothetical protein
MEFLTGKEQSDIDELQFDKFCKDNELSFERIRENPRGGTKRPDRTISLSGKKYLLEIKSICPNEEERESLIEHEKTMRFSSHTTTQKMRRRLDSPIQSCIKQFKAFKNEFDYSKGWPTILLMFDHRELTGFPIFDMIHSALAGDVQLKIGLETGRILGRKRVDSYENWVDATGKEGSLSSIDLFASFRFKSSDEGTITFYRNQHSKFDFSKFENENSDVENFYFQSWNEC